MSLYILDTDCLSLYQRGHRQVVSKLLSVPPANRAITIITVEEQLRGRLNQIRKARATDKYVRACSALHDATRFFASIRIIDFSEQANSHFQGLRKVNPRKGTQDLRIAAIVLSVGGTLVTQNLSDFEGIADLMIEDWTS